MNTNKLKRRLDAHSRGKCTKRQMGYKCRGTNERQECGPTQRATGDAFGKISGAFAASLIAYLLLRWLDNDKETA